jgi:anti-sigma factor RsiW
VSAPNDRLRDLIQADLDGALSAAERAELARLLLQDPEARRLHGQLQRTDQLLRDIPAAVRRRACATW